MTHVPVLCHEVVDALEPRQNEVYVDATFGGGGYTQAVFDAAPSCYVLGIDRDPSAIERAKSFGKRYPSQFSYHHGKFSDLGHILDAHGHPYVDGVMLDIGVSSYQIDEAARGFSFRFDAPLHMTMGCNALTAYDVVNTYSETDLAQVLYEGEERHSRRIARKIVQRRSEALIKTTGELASIIESCKPFSKNPQHPATVAFQALRMHVNDELLELKKVLETCKKRLKPGGRLVIVTFHSLEDRIVKNFFKTESGDIPAPSRHMPLTNAQMQRQNFPAFTLPFKKAKAPLAKEVEDNPRARSAKLRAGVRTSHGIIL